MLDTPPPAAKPSQPSGSRDIAVILGLGKARPIASRWRKIGWFALVLIGSLSAYGWLAGKNGTGVRYVTEPTSRGSLTVIVTATGSAQPVKQVNVSSELSGTVRKVNVDYNSQVKVGDVLAELDTEKLKATVQSYRARLATAKAKAADTAATIVEKKAEFERKRTLASKDLGSARDLDVAKAAFERAEAQHAMALADIVQAESEMHLNEINLSKACICSPVDGIVLKRSVDPGQIVASSLQAPVLFLIAEDLRQMELQVDVDEADVGKVKIGQSVNFSVDAYPDRKFPAKVRDIRFGSETVQGVVTYKAVLTIDNAEFLIRPGMTATAEIVVQKIEDALLVPNAALRFSPPPAQQKSGGLLRALLPVGPGFRSPSKPEAAVQGQRVWILKDGVPVAVPVVAGATDGRRTEIRKGDIAPGTAVVTEQMIAKP